MILVNLSCFSSFVPVQLFLIKCIYRLRFLQNFNRKETGTQTEPNSVVLHISRSETLRHTVYFCRRSQVKCDMRITDGAKWSTYRLVLFQSFLTFLQDFEFVHLAESFCCREFVTLYLYLCSDFGFVCFVGRFGV